MSPAGPGTRQAIIIVGGYNSVWPSYLRMARCLEDLSGLPVVAVPLMAWDWWRAGRAANATNLLSKLRDTVAWARHRLSARRLILVGHSAGGLLGRLYLCDEPVWGTVYGGVEHVTALITLGSPHCCARGARVGWFLANVANLVAPGAPYADRVRYRAVAGRALRGAGQGTYKERRASRAYEFFGGQAGVWGDGIVPVYCARLDGAENIELEGVTHSIKSGPQWYGGSAAIMARWWPPEVTRGF